jgi:hypothetical protein
MPSTGITTNSHVFTEQRQIIARKEMRLARTYMSVPSICLVCVAARKELQEKFSETRQKWLESESENDLTTVVEKNTGPGEEREGMGQKCRPMGP